MILSVLTGKKGFLANRVIPCASRKRRVSSAWYSPLFRIPCKETAGDTLFVALNTPPSRIGT
jgi:hypothetical protein